MTYAIHETLVTQSQIKRLIYVTQYNRAFPRVGSYTENYPTTFTTLYVAT
jgi:hypothetical protein